MRKLLFLLAVFVFSSCSQYSNSLLSRGWHNLNSRYNALLIAREDIEIAQEYITLNHQDNFEELIPIYRYVDSSRLDTAGLYLTDAIKKSSVIVERHSNSKYLDEAYLLIGEARILKGEFETAIETYKYLNSITEEDAIRAESLSQMMRAYVERGDYQSAEQLITLLKGQPMTKKNRLTHLKNMAYYHQKTGDIVVSAVFLEEAVKTMRKGPEKARIHFVLGQIYEKLDRIPEARRNYRAVLKNKPDYDLNFNSNLGLLMTESLAKNTNIAFEKMLQDRKNQDLKHKIYYKMGETSRNKRQPFEAIDYFEQALSEVSGDDNISKGFIYKAIGDVYLDDLIDYENAAVYYDSTVITFPPGHLRTTDIGDRAAFLNEFIKYRKVYQLEDSLQKLATLSPEILDYTLEKIIKDKKEAEKLKKEAGQAIAQTSVTQATQPAGRKWRLYDEQQIVREKNEFVMRWGNRVLEDDWRRSEKSGSRFVFDEEERKMVEQTIVPADSTADVPVLGSASQINMEEQEQKLLQEEIAEFKKRIPLTRIQMIASERKQEEAVYRIAKIYKLKFKDDLKANEAFNQFLQDYPRSHYTPEVLYFLALDEPDRLENPYAERLLKEFPNTSYGRQIRKGTIVMNEDREEEAGNYYSQAFKMYDAERYNELVGFLEEGLNEYVGSQIEDKMAMLRIYALAKVGTMDQYMISLNDFIRSYPTSNLISKARELLETLEENG